MTTTPRKTLVSQLLREDSDLRDIIEEFVDGLPTRLEALQHAFDNLDWSQLAVLTHQLKGACGSYGYPDLSGLAATMEKAFRNQQTGDFPKWISQLQEMITAAKAGLQTQ